MSKKKILFVIDSLECGGAEKSLNSLLNAFDFEKYDVKLQLFSLTGGFLTTLTKEVEILPELPFVAYCKLNLFDKLKVNNFKFLIYRIYLAIGIRIERIKNKIHPSQAYWKYAQSAFNTYNEKFDVAIAWGQGFPTHYVASKIVSNKKFAVINADYASLKLNHDFDLEYYSSFTKILTVSDKLGDLTRNVFPEFDNKIFTLYDIINADLIKQLAEYNEPFENVPGYKFVTVGRLVKAKGYDILLDAAKILKECGINFKWYIVGEGSERQIIEKQIQDFNLEKNVILLGEKNNPYFYMKNADIYIQTSINEGYCITLAEARILNIPVVSTNFDVVYNQISHRVNGLISEKNGKSVASAIIELLSDNELRENIVNNLSFEKKGNIEEIYKLYKYIEE